MTEQSGTSHTMRALTELRQRILNGELPGGMRLLEVSMAKTLEISRTPVRDAMWRLAEEGLLERAKNGGFVVRAFGHEDVVDAIELRGVLEGTAARLAAERGVDSAALANIASIVTNIDSCMGDTPADIDFELYSQLNAEFHLALAALSGSKIIERELSRVTKLPFASPSAFLPDKVAMADGHSSLTMAQAQHREIVSSIANREGARAEALAREHARTALRDLEKVFAKKADTSDQVINLSLFVK